MTLADEITLTRSLADETVTSAVLTDSEITRFLNNRYNEVNSELMRIDGAYYGAIDQTVDLVADQANYDLPDEDSESVTRIERILHVKIAYDGSNFRRALPIDPISINDSNFDNVVYTQNNPVYYLLAQEIYLLPTPTAAATNALKIWYQQRPAELSNDDDVPAFSPQYHHILAYGAAADIKRKEGDPGTISLLRDMEGQYQLGLQKLKENMQPRDASYPPTVVDINTIENSTEWPEFFVPPSSLSV